MKPESHQSITRFALTLFTEECQEDSSLFVDDGCLEAVLRGVKAEDDKTVKRGLNWHFYPANEVIAKEKRKVLFIKTLRPTSEWIVAERLQELEGQWQGHNTADVYETFGRILHHIQDMSTPSHVVPIYHGPRREDTYESYLFTRWPSLKRELFRRKGNFLRLLQVPAGDDFQSLYQIAGRRLLQELQTGAGLFPVALNHTGNGSVESEAFWRPYDPESESSPVMFGIRGFGTFGPLGAAYGQCRQYAIGGRRHEVEDRMYARVAVHFVSRAVEDTLRALQHFSRTYALLRPVIYQEGAKNV